MLRGALRGREDPLRARGRLRGRPRPRALGRAAAQPLRARARGALRGPETNGCRSCHWRGGPAGAGDLPDAALLFGDGDRTSSADPRNPPSLAGAGVVEALAAQLTADLAAIRRARSGRRRARGARWRRR
ncbi:MAG: hypothetical protein M5U28_14640 [Sandaracinaceae bacterium]|nr:hypothetical protein [Sandaracinaceae bacterium]